MLSNLKIFDFQGFQVEISDKLFQSPKLTIMCYLYSRHSSSCCTTNPWIQSKSFWYWSSLNWRRCWKVTNHYWWLTLKWKQWILIPNLSPIAFLLKSVTFLCYTKARKPFSNFHYFRFSFSAFCFDLFLLLSFKYF